MDGTEAFVKGIQDRLTAEVQHPSADRSVQLEAVEMGEVFKNFQLFGRVLAAWEQKISTSNADRTLVLEQISKKAEAEEARRKASEADAATIADLRNQLAGNAPGQP